jgi:AhpD family alkylhydroperoxidase
MAGLNFLEIQMTPRLNAPRVAPAAYHAMMTLQGYVKSTRIEPALAHLVYLRASHLNGCAYCIDMHTKDARAAGESEQRLYAIPVWHETPFFSPRERAALAFTEAVTQIGIEGVPDDVFAQARAEFDEQELVELTIAIITINGWNRLSVTFRTEVGSYQPPAAAPASR